VHLLAQPVALGGHGVPECSRTLRTIGFSAAPGLLNVLGIVPLLGALVWFVAAYHALENWDAEVVMKPFRERLLARLVERHAIS